MDQNLWERIFLIDFGNFSDFFLLLPVLFLERETGEGSEMSGDLPKKNRHYRWQSTFVFTTHPILSLHSETELAFMLWLKLIRDDKSGNELMNLLLKKDVSHRSSLSATTRMFDHFFCGLRTSQAKQLPVWVGQATVIRSRHLTIIWTSPWFTGFQTW